MTFVQSLIVFASALKVLLAILLGFIIGEKRFSKPDKTAIARLRLQMIAVVLLYVLVGLMLILLQ